MDADTIINKILAFFGPVANSIKGSVNTAEIVRVTLTALVSGGGVLGVLTAYQGDLSVILTSPTPVSLALAGYALTFVIDLARRLNHGTRPRRPRPRLPPRLRPRPRLPARLDRTTSRSEARLYPPALDPFGGIGGSFMELTVGKKGGGGRVGFGNPSNKGPKNLGGSKGAGGRVTGGGTRAALARITGGAGGGHDQRWPTSPVRPASIRRMPSPRSIAWLRANEAEFTYLSANAAAILRGNGQAVPERDGRPVRGFRMTGSVA